MQVATTIRVKVCATHRMCRRRNVACSVPSARCGLLGREPEHLTLVGAAVVERAVADLELQPGASLHRRKPVDQGKHHELPDGAGQAPLLYDQVSGSCQV